MFKIKRLPEKLTSLLIELQIYFNDLQWMHFQSLLISLLITPYKSTISGMVKVLGFGTHRSKHNAFLINLSRVIIKVLRLYAENLLTLLKKSGEPIYFIIDDTKNRKRGKHIAGAYKFFDHISKTYIWGQQIVCSVILYRNILIPYSFDVYIPKQQCDNLKIKFRKKTQIALEQLKAFESDEGTTVFVLADTFYATQDIIKYCRLKKQHFVSCLKYNRKFRINGRLTSISSYIKNTIRTFKNKTKIKIGKTKYHTVTKQVVLKTGGVVKLVFSKHTAHSTAMVLFTVFFKMSKQHLGFNAYQSRELKAINSHIALSMLSHNLLTHAYITSLREKGKSLTKKNISKFSVLDMLNNIRYESNIDTINYCIENIATKSKNKLKNEFKKILNKAA
jgi:hypothetical protein